MKSRSTGNEQLSVNGYGLTNAEKEIFKLIAEGKKKREIAGCLHLSVHTVKTHIEDVYRKLGVHTAAAAVAKLLVEHIFVDRPPCHL